MTIPKAIPKTARVISSVEIAAETRHLTLEISEPAALGFIGGQYVIVDSGIVLPSGKAAKRAYSILSSDGEQTRVELATMRLPGGPGSGYMHEQRPGAEIRFSGPWGKLCSSAEVERALLPSTPRSTLLLATDTGVTAILGLARGERFAPLLEGCTFVWLRPSSGYFLPEDFVRAHLPPNLREVRIGTLPPPNHPERVSLCRAFVRDLQERAPLGQAFIAGDGLVNYALVDDLVAAGVPATRDSVESFFNMPKKSAPAPEMPATAA